MAKNTPNLFSSWANRKAKQDFKQRYNRLFDNKIAKFDDNVYLPVVLLEQ